MKALVLGATGFIGGHIARKALEAGWQVRGLRRNPGSIGHLEGLPVEWMAGDLTEVASLRAAMRGVETVFHAAAYYPKRGDRRRVPDQVEYAREEITSVLEAAQEAGVKRLVYTSSLTTIGQPPPGEARLADERDFYTPGSLAKSGYYEAKFAMEKLVLEAAGNGLPALALNPTAVFGPGDVHLTLGGLLLAVSRGWVPAWLPGMVNVVDVRDVAAAHIAAAGVGKTGERYILGGHNLSIREALRVAALAANRKPPFFEIPLWVVDVLVAAGDALPFLPLPANHLRAIRLWQAYDASKAEIELGLKPRPFEETVRDALSWFEKQGQLS
jgi:dihydroflavonol-4-reductase